jgi:hypothetical protein
MNEFRSYFDGNGACQAPKVWGLTTNVVESVNTRFVVAKYLVKVLQKVYLYAEQSRTSFSIPKDSWGNKQSACGM